MLINAHCTTIVYWPDRYLTRTFSIVSGVLPSAIAALFGYLLPIIMRRLSKYQGATTRSRLDRAVMARYFAFLIISNFIIFSLLGVVWCKRWQLSLCRGHRWLWECIAAVAQIIAEAGKHKSFKEIMDGLTDFPNSKPFLLSTPRIC